MRLFGKPYPCLRQVIVNTRSERAFRGVLWDRQGGYLVLRNAELLKAKNETVAIDGEVVVDVGNVDFVQVL